METIEDREVVTRKEHKCLGCVKQFPAGSRLRKCAVAVDGGVNRCYVCAVCNEIMLIMARTDSYYANEGFDWGFVRENLLTNETPEQCLERLKAAKPGGLL